MMASHQSVIDAATSFWVHEGEPSRDFLTGFLRGHRDAEVSLPETLPPKATEVYKIAYKGGYEYARRVVAPYEKRVQKKDRKSKK
jgi:hypothetical protein